MGTENDGKMGERVGGFEMQKVVKWNGTDLLMGAGKKKLKAMVVGKVESLKMTT